MSGVTSSPAPLVVFGDLTSLTVVPHGQPRLGIGGRLDVHVDGCFDGGLCGHLTQSGQPYALVSSDPTVLEVVDTTAVREVSGGTALLTATAPGGTPVSAPIEVTVRGTLLADQPVACGDHARHRRGPGLPAIGHYPPDFTGLVTQDSCGRRAILWSPSRPTSPATGVASGGRTGTTTISATDPATGVRSSDTGDDLVLTVLPASSIASSSRRPSCAAWRASGGVHGHRLLSRRQQPERHPQVEWTTSASSVAGAFGPPNRKSLFQATGAGVAVIGAVHPQGVRASDRGHDAVMEVDAVVALSISPKTRVPRPARRRIHRARDPGERSHHQRHAAS